jgi:hypothetical protein
MKNIFVRTLGLLLLLSTVSFAQQDPQPDNPAQTPPIVQPGTVGEPGATGTATQTSEPQGTGTTSTATSQSDMAYTGCLSGTEGNYTLSDSSTGTTYSIDSDQDIAAHVGKQVEVHGTLSEAQSGMAGDQNSQTSAGAGTQAQQKLEITDVRVVSETCANETGDTKDDSTTPQTR